LRQPLDLPLLPGLGINAGGLTTKEILMLNRIRFRFPVTFLLLCLLACGPAVHAQETAAAATGQQDSQSGEDLIDQLQQYKRELAELNKAYAAAEDLERAMLWSQIRNKRKVLTTGLAELISQTEELEAAGQDAGQSRTVSHTLITSLTASIEKGIAQGQQRIYELREQRASTPEEELAALDDEIEERSTAIDEDLTTYAVLTQMLEAQGADPAAQYRYLDATVKKRAEALGSVLQFLTEERTSIGKLAPGATEEEKQAQAAQLAAYDEGIDEVAAHLNAAVAIMKDRGLETASYTKLIIASTGELTEDIFQAEVAFGLLQGWIESSKGWVLENGPRWGARIIVFVLILLAFKFLAGIVKRLVRKAVTASNLNLSQLLRNQIEFFSGKVVMFVGLLVALSQLGVQVGPVLAGLGIAGFIVGFALQDTLSNFAAGMMILIYRPFDVGDAVEAGGVMGKVKAMNLVSTTITTWDNQKLVVPNSKIWGDVIRNITAEPNRRVDMSFGISYSDNIDHAERILSDIVRSHELVLAEPEPDIKLHTLGESSVNFIVRPWARTSDYWTVYWDITRAVKQRFDAEGISIPFPQRDVHLIQEKPATG
jgi:small conductance mechanosensitive channel